MSEVNAAAPAASETPTTTETVEPAQAPAGEAAKTEQNLEAQVKDAKTPEAKAEAKARLEKFKLKVDGKEEEMELDLNNKEELTKHLQLSKAAQKRMQESAELRNSFKQFVDILKQNPEAILGHPDIGVDVKKFAQDILNRELEEQKKSPERREIEKLQKELQDIREKEKKDKETSEAAEMQRLQDEQEKTLTNDIMSALDSVKLPKSHRAVRYMAEYMSLALKNGVDLNASDVAPLVLKQMKDEYQEMIRSLDDASLENFIDKDVQGRLQKKRIASLKAPVENINTIKTSGVPKKETQETTKKKKTIQDFLNE